MIVHWYVYEIFDHFVSFKEHSCYFLALSQDILVSSMPVLIPLKQVVFLVALVSFRKQGKAQRLTEKHQKDWPNLGYLNIKKEWWGLAHTSRDLWNSYFIHQNHASIVLLGADFKLWPMPKLSLRNIYFSQVNPVHFLVLHSFPKALSSWAWTYGIFQ